MKIYRDNNPIKRKETCKKYYNINKERYPERYYWRNLLKHTLERLGMKKESKTHKILGYSALELRVHLRTLYEPWMNDNNNGIGPDCWHIDHIRPVSSFPKDTHPSIVCALSNLRPLRSTENLSKGSKYIEKD